MARRDTRAERRTPLPRPDACSLTGRAWGSAAGPAQESRCRAPEAAAHVGTGGLLVRASGDVATGAAPGSARVSAVPVPAQPPRGPARAARPGAPTRAGA